MPMITKFQTTKRFFLPLLPSFLLTLASLIFEYDARAIVIFSPVQLIRPLIIMWIILLLLIWPLYKITGDRHWTGLALFAFVIIFYLGELLFYTTFTILLITLSSWVIISLLLKKKLKIKLVTFLSSSIAVFFFLAFTILAIPNFLSVNWELYRSSFPRQTYTLKVPESAPKYKPDVYYIIMDGYGRSDTLQKFYQYDNSEFINYLTQKGFVVPSNIYSNYAKTSMSVPSTLNLNYMQAIVPGIEDSLFWWLMNPFIQESYVQLFLEEAGYQTVSIATDWDITNNTNTDFYFSPYKINLNEFEASLLAKTQLKILRPLISKLAFVPTSKSHRDLILYSFDTLSIIPEISGPKFVFAHIVSPHPPFVLDKKGNLSEPKYSFSFNDGNDFAGTYEEYRTGYINQLEFVNIKLQQTIDSILTKSKSPPVIILIADHGPGMLTDFTSSENTCLEERFAIFAALYLPGLEGNSIPNDITPVNLFRIIFNEYFSTELPLLENASYYYKDTVYIYRVEDISQDLYDLSESEACLQVH